MDRQQVFTTTLWGFEKKAVLDYIYVQDMEFKKKEAEYEGRILELEEKLDSYESVSPIAEQYKEQLDALSITYKEEKVSLQARYDKLNSEVEQLIKVASGKERELQLQLELNSQLKTKCETLEDKLKVLAEHLLAERELASSVPDPSVIPHLEVAQQKDEQPVPAIFDVEPEVVAKAQPEDETLQCDEVVDLKEELDEFRQSVSKTLLNFEAALAKLETGKSDTDVEDAPVFFR